MNITPPKKPGVCDVCGSKLIQREDDRREVVERRYRIYAKNMQPIIKFYRNRGIYVRVDGDGRVEEVWKRIQPLLDYIRSRETSFQGHPSGP